MVARRPPGCGAARGGVRLGPRPRPVGDATRLVRAAASPRGPGRRDDPVVARRRRGRDRRGQRSRLRAPPRAGRDGRRQPRPPDGRAVVRPGRAAHRRGRDRGAGLPLDQAARRPDRRGLRRRRRPARAGARARPGAHPRRPAPPRRAGRRARSCSTSSPTTLRPSRSTHASVSSTRPPTRTSSTAAAPDRADPHPAPRPSLAGPYLASPLPRLAPTSDIHGRNGWTAHIWRAISPMDIGDVGRGVWGWGCVGVGDAGGRVSGADGRAGPPRGPR